ncbi:aspartate-semialdehyde dehydrogenase [Geothrix sp. 21YS21S-4]|uniref:aspartate-semialdehyde dehydrogenase n=1 Tax=Geothrix sp. 21YS21S-4 TaxID=3068889 RepID=UPI0027BA62CC|nr:aspartate-semialdehyde dehydrogenase [Geothrix sp. 21YS21S-4]
MTPKIPVTVLGATGVVGQRFVRRLAQHPLFRIEHLAASERSAGKRYRDACAWRLDGEPYGGLGDQVMAAGTPETALSPVVFSALDTEPARDLEPAFARAGALVFSNAAAFRMSPEVPLLVPEVNAEHLGLLDVQRHHHGWSGGIVTNANCTTTVLVMALAPLHRAFGVEAVMMTSMQAVSGAGYPGVASLDILGNVIPFIRNEEPKVEEETPKLLGRFNGTGVDFAPMAVSALCHRVPVLEGHTEAVSVKLKGNPPLEAVREAWEAWRPEPQRLGLFSAPKVAVRVHTLEDRPQVRRDVEMDEGMSVHVGRLRPCPILGVKFALLGHNTERGAAGGSILNAELAHAKGYLR